MKNMKHLISALPLVADALGRKYGVRVQIGGEKAYTDGKNINIPALPLEADETALNLARGYLDHEAAHLRITDFGTVKKAGLTSIEKHVWNILEDYMVENKLSAIYPGCAHNFNWLAKHIFMNPDKENTRSPAEMVFDWILIAVRSFAVHELATERLRLELAIKTEYPGLFEALEPVVKAVPQLCQNTASCIMLAKELVSIIQKYVEDHSENTRQFADGQNSENQQESAKTGNKTCENPQEGNEQEGEKDKNNKSTPQNKDMDTPEKAQTSASGQSENPRQTDNLSSEGQDEGGDQTEKPVTLKELLEDSEPVAESDLGTLAGRLLEAMGQSESVTKLEVAVASKGTSTALSPAEVSSIKSKTSALRARLSALLQSKILSRNLAGRNGKVDCRRIARLSEADSRIFSKAHEREGINTTVHILLDASGSMQNDGKIKLACHACFAMAEVLDKILGVTVAVTSFPNGLEMDSQSHEPKWETVCPILSCKQKFHANFQVRANGSTPMASALWWVLQQMKRQSEKRKILLVLSDGMPDNVPETIQAIDAHLSCGHEVYGIGILTAAITSIIKDENCKSIYDLAELAQAMFDLLQPALLRKAGGKA